MAEDTIIRFFTKPTKITHDLVQSIIDACIARNSVYEGAFNVDTDFKSYTGTLEDAIDKISSSEGGQIYFMNKYVGFYSVSITSEKGARTRQLGNIQIRPDGGNFKKEDTGPKCAQEVLKLAKAVWASLDKKPVYGYGDEEDHLPIYVPPSEPESHPNDDDILALDVPINKFWLNFYGQDMIEKFGKERLKKGAYLVEELNDGLLVATDVVPTVYKNGWGKTPEQKKREVKEFMEELESLLKEKKKNK